MSRCKFLSNKVLIDCMDRRLTHFHIQRLKCQNFQTRPLASAWLIELACRWRIPERFFVREEYVSALELFLCSLRVLEE